MEVVQDLVKPIHIATPSYLNLDVSIVQLLYWKKIESHFET